MRKTAAHIISGITVCLSAVLLASCQKHLEQTASVQLHIGLPVSIGVEEGPWTKAGASEDEGIKTLRIIAISGVPSDVDRDILYNDIVYGLEDVSSYETTIPNLPIGQMTFYVIANEESIGMEYDDKAIMDNLVSPDPEQSGSSKKLLYVDNGTSEKHFPRLGSQIENGLPMSGYTQVELTGDQSVKIDIYRSVVKLSLSVANATTSAVTLNNVSFGAFFADRYYMFRETTLDVPERTNYSEESFSVADQNITIGPEDTVETMNVYFYTTHPDFGVGESPFTIRIETGGKLYSKRLFAADTDFFVRNTQINLLASITTTVGIDLDFTVLPWTDYTVKVPSFD